MRAMFLVIVTAVIPNIASAYYAAHMGRFTSRDPFGEVMRIGAGTPTDSGTGIGFIARDRFSSTPGYQDGMNLYEYVRSTPTIALDPSGQLVHPPVEAVPIICTPVGAAATACVVGPVVAYRVSECTLAPLTGWVVDWWTRPRDPEEVPCKLIGSAPRKRQEEVRCTYSCGDHGQKEIFIPWPHGTPEPRCDLEKKFWF
jgi:hypothetical protein